MPRSRRQKPERGPRRATSSGSIPALESPAPTTIKKPVGFLSLPRELRDQVYAYLLSTEYNKHEPELPPFGTLRCGYVYPIHTSIVYTNRQVSNEACQAFFMNNLLVHISLSWDPMSDFTFGRFGIRLLRYGTLSKHCAMKVDLSSGAEVPQNHKKYNIQVTYRELPGLCRSLLWTENDSPGRLALTKLKLIIGDEVGTDGARVKKDKTTKGHNEKTIGTTSSRVRRLLEPFRRLHSIKDLQIIGPLSDIYKSEVIADMSKPPPSNKDLFNFVFISLEKAMDKFDSGDFASSIPEYLNTLDELDDAHKRERSMIDFDDEIFSDFCDACVAIDFAVWTELAWAYLNTGDINTADRWLFQIVRRYTRSYCGTRLRGHDAIMISHLDSQIREKLSVVHDHNCCLRFYYPLYLRKLLKEKLRHEPENGLLVQELEKQEAEVAKKKEIQQYEDFEVRQIWYWHTNQLIEEW